MKAKVPRSQSHNAAALASPTDELLVRTMLHILQFKQRVWNCLNIPNTHFLHLKTLTCPSTRGK